MRRLLLSVLLLLSGAVCLPENAAGRHCRDTEDWVYRTDPRTGRPEKFFGIGFWRVPGYSPTTVPDLDESGAKEYAKRTSWCNIVLSDPRSLKPYMHDRIQMITNFANPVFGRYLDKAASWPQTPDKDYYRNRYLQAHIDDPAFAQALDDALDSLIRAFDGCQRIYAPIDEIALGGLTRWFLPAELGDKIYERIRRKEVDPIVLVDLLGHGRGSTFFFEKNYRKTHKQLPADPPYDVLEERARLQKQFPLLGFFQAHDGTPVYRFDAEGKYAYADLDTERLKAIWYENVRQVAAAYKHNGNDFSLNAFRDFFACPALAAVTTDALKAGLGKKPVWLYFDGNGYAKPASMSPQEYVRLVKCQIYTSLVHGATGVMFWNDGSKGPAVFDALQPMLQALQEDLPVVKMRTVERRIRGELHLMVKRDASGRRYVIATNTGRTEAVSLPFPIAGKQELAPLEVLVSAL